MAVKYIYKWGNYNDYWWFPLCWIFALYAAIYLPVLVARVVEKLNTPKMLRKCIGLN